MRGAGGCDGRASCEGAGLLTEVALAAWASASPFVIFPLGPVAGIDAGFNLFSSTIRRTAGARVVLDGDVFAGAVVLDAACAVGWWLPLGGVAAVLSDAKAVPLGSTIPSTEPTETSDPVAAEMAVKIPAEGAGTSTVTLSVSSSTKGSSALRASPTFLNHLATVASLTLSPSWGTRISTAMIYTFLFFAKAVGVVTMVGFETGLTGAKAASNKAACSATWRLWLPVAGEAASGRPIYLGRWAL